MPTIGDRLDGLPLPNPSRPQGRDVEYFNRHGGGNRNVDVEDDHPDEGDEEPDALKQKVQSILEQMYYDILHESPNKRCHTEGAWTNIPRALREQEAVEELYMRPELPFYAVQYVIADQETWKVHFNRFFPPEVPSWAGQNFGKCRYFHSYLDLIRQLPRHRLRLVRAELRRKFDSMVWIPNTESDRMWSTKRSLSNRWTYLPNNGNMEGPKIAINGPD
ncbi:hypothetical protein BKA83DRAFT_4068589 [Pisolithus microcarpus]|nr:hypothetical protein BKA83DRAFT_4068589 [Pisolithus microcarpus]